jgi:hypothetical protein
MTPCRLFGGIRFLVPFRAACAACLPIPERLLSFQEGTQLIAFGGIPGVRGDRFRENVRYFNHL